MMLSEWDPQRLDDLTDEQVTHIVYDAPLAVDEPALAALVLGGPVEEMGERARAAAALYKEGLAPCLIPTGGVKRTTPLGELTEAEYLGRRLEEAGVPREAILPENEATTTRENMLFGSVLLERARRPRGTFSVYVVTSANHLRRSMALAQLYLPRTARILGRAAHNEGGMPGEWTLSEYWVHSVRTELKLLKGLIDRGEIDDIVL